MSRTMTSLLALSMLLTPLALAQQAGAPAKKLYCWDENGQRVCSDALPAEAVNRARDEISVKSGLRMAEVDRALTEDEREQLATNEAQQQVDQAAADMRRRTDQAMLMSYQNETELGRVFSERTSIVENSIRTARFNVISLRESLVTLLRSASDLELAGREVPADMAESIVRRHDELMRQRQLQASFEKQRVDLDTEITDTVRRYRLLKGVEPASSTDTASVTSPAAQASGR